MDHVSNLFPNKSKFLQNSTPANGDPESIVLPQPVEPPAPSSPTPLASEPVMPAPVPPNATESIDLAVIKTSLYKIKDQVEILLRVVEGKELPNSAPTGRTQNFPVPQRESTDQILEGAFTGEKMLSDSGELFDVPPNYASKSKLVEGDRMKLTITQKGSFIYKQIHPIERKRVRGELIAGTNSGQWLVSSEGKDYKVLTAAVTFHRGRIGDEVVLLLPSHGHSDWGAIEHIIHKEL